MSIDSEIDLWGMMQVSQVAVKARDTLAAATVVGATPRDLDQLCGEIYREFGAESAPRVFYSAPVNAFISVNDVIVHGLPTTRKFRQGDVVKIDVTPMLNGYVSDTATTVVLGPQSKTGADLSNCAKMAFFAALQAVRPGNRVSEIGKRIEGFVRAQGFSVIKGLTGHGVGRHIHEEPTIPNYEERRQTDRIGLNTVLAIEPMISAGSGEVEQRPDGWTIGTMDLSLTAHYEHTILVRNDEPMILTA